MINNPPWNLVKLSIFGLVIGANALLNQSCEGARKDLELAKAEIDSIRQMGEKAKEIFGKPSERAVYYGILPCTTGCQGIETTLIIRADKTALYKKRELGNKATEEALYVYPIRYVGDTLFLVGSVSAPGVLSETSALTPFVPESGGALRACMETKEGATRVKPLLGESNVLQRISR